MGMDHTTITTVYKKGFSTDLEQFGHAESENDIHFSGSGQVFVLTQFKKNQKIRNQKLDANSKFLFLDRFFQINVAKIDELFIVIVLNSFIYSLNLSFL